MKTLKQLIEELKENWEMETWEEMILKKIALATIEAVNITDNEIILEFVLKKYEKDESYSKVLDTMYLIQTARISKIKQFLGEEKE